MEHPAIALQSLLSLSVLIGLVFLFERSYRENIAFTEECESFELLLAWRQANPTLGVGDSLYAQSLVLRRIRAYDRYSSLFVCNQCSRIAHLSYLYSLLSEHGEPPTPPKQYHLFETEEKQ